MQLRKEAWKKKYSGLQRGVNPRPRGASAMLYQHSCEGYGGQVKLEKQYKKLCRNYCVKKRNRNVFYCLYCYPGLDEQTAKDINSRLQAAKTYMKTDYKIHVSKADPCPDHCSVFALSTDVPEYQGCCDHEHNIVCDRCDDYRNALADLQLSLSSAVKYRCVYAPAELDCSLISILLFFYLRKAQSECTRPYAPYSHPSLVVLAACFTVSTLAPTPLHSI